MLQLHDTLTKQKREFKPINPGKISLYVCGMTVYDFCHIGHARGVMVGFDTIVRYLRYRGYDVTYVRNITDIDDKIINRAVAEGVDFTNITERYIAEMHQDEAALGVLPPNIEPRATDNLDKIISLIETLIAKDMAYVGDNGDVYYAVKKFENYGALSGRDLENLQAGARVDIVEAKRDPLDFVLWKVAKPGEPSWTSPWGEGRPGWHIECSAMSMNMLGDNFDIHGGGPDLIFPHHENEIAQSEAASGKKFANYWLHCGALRIKDEKMSKSLGNFLTIRDALKRYHPETIRYFLLFSHYRSPINYSEESMHNAHQALERFYTALRGLPEVTDIEMGDYEKRFQVAMDDDFNTPETFAVLFDMSREINRLKETDLSQAARLANGMKKLAEIFGILHSDPDTFLHGSDGDDIAQQVEAMIVERNQARQTKDWALADKVRDDLLAQGIELEDGPDGTIWRRKS